MRSTLTRILSLGQQTIHTAVARLRSSLPWTRSTQDHHPSLSGLRNMFGSSQPSSDAAAGGGGSFGSLGLGANAEPPAKRKSIFDTTSAQTAQPQPQPQQSSFLAPASTAAPSSTSMFPQSTNAGQSQGLLGAVPSTSAPASGTFSFLGGPGSQQQPQAQQQPQTQPQQSGLGASIFSNAPQGQPSQQQPLGQSQSRDPAHFNSLLERQRKRQRFGASNQNGRFGQLPNLNMDLGDLARRAQEIGGSGQKTTSVSGVVGHQRHKVDLCKICRRTRH